MFFNKKILLGICGGIAAYKACEIIREIRKMHGAVRVVLTEAGNRFVTPLTLAALSENVVLQDLFAGKNDVATVHIEAARWADVILVCPATANTIGKAAAGIADNLLTTLIMAANVPVLFCPAMNKEMYGNQLLQKNIIDLKKVGYHFIEPEQGELACGEIGWGRLASNGRIIAGLKKLLCGSDKLAGRKILVTAGRTEEPIDPVRYLSNHSTGKMGFALAEAAALNGAEVTLISGPTTLVPFAGITYYSVQTAQQMAAKVEEHYASHEIIMMAAAVADFAPAHYQSQKIKKSKENFALQLVKTKDILQTIGAQKGNHILIGFALETENEEVYALRKMRDKNLDMIIVNNPKQPGAGFGVDTNAVKILHANGQRKELPVLSKSEVAEKIINELIQLIK